MVNFSTQLSTIVIKKSTALKVLLPGIPIVKWVNFWNLFLYYENMDSETFIFLERHRVTCKKTKLDFIFWEIQVRRSRKSFKFIPISIKFHSFLWFCTIRFFIGYYMLNMKILLPTISICFLGWIIITNYLLLLIVTIIYLSI